ncbi:putative transcriptional regulator [Frankia sp. EI5c]|uniref:MerR family transcriptional regulator n=1 Tax=Frankia sp. EI5c TaxID=683316 RepID=UPI0007C2FF45|nr:MerR family transcriptional regulator [Frankia sp. EI5c]OAA27742.1 putative transcriptional regulator [Frankia sp. EI5c]
MRIGELAARAGTSPRQVRYYEAKGLITSTRGANNYRDYTETTLARVRQIRELLRAGLSTQLILAILPCLESPRDPIVFEGVTPETVAALEGERDRLSERIDVLSRNRDAVARYLAELQQHANGPVPADS